MNIEESKYRIVCDGEFYAIQEKRTIVTCYDWGEEDSTVWSFLPYYTVGTKEALEMLYKVREEAQYKASQLKDNWRVVDESKIRDCFQGELDKKWKNTENPYLTETQKEQFTESLNKLETK
jgi:hypothetical protein